MKNQKSTGTSITHRRIRRSSVYAATIVAMVAMTGGFALAALSVGYSQAYSSFAGGTTSMTYVSSVLTPSAAPTIVSSAGSGTCTSPTALTGSAQTIEVAANGATCTNGDDELEFTYTENTFSCATGDGDTMTITVAGSDSGTSTTAVTCAHGVSFTGAILTVAIDFGPGAQYVTSASIVISQTAGHTGF